MGAAASAVRPRKVGAGVRSRPPTRPNGECIMGKRARKKKARRKNGANHGKRPNS